MPKRRRKVRLPRRVKTRRSPRQSTRSRARPFRARQILKGVTITTTAGLIERKKARVRKLEKPKFLRKRRPKVVYRAPRIYRKKPPRGARTRRTVKMLRLYLRVIGNEDSPSLKGREGRFIKHVPLTDAKDHYKPRTVAEVEHLLPDLTARLERLYRGKFTIQTMSVEYLDDKGIKRLRAKP